VNYSTQTGYIKNSTIRSEYAAEQQAQVGLGSAYDDAKTPHRAIPQAFANLEKDLYALGELVNALNNRLKPISRAESPANETETGRPMIDVPMVNTIATADHMLRGSLRQLQDIIERLEV
jgi:hypothetical protein